MLRISSCSVFSYTNKLKLKFATARGSIGPRINHVIALTAQARGLQLEGYGESAPRGLHLTKDPPVLVPAFLERAASMVAGASFSLDDIATCKADISALLESLSAMGRELAAGTAGNMPFRGSLVGIETALLDIASQAFNQRLGVFLGGYRSDLTVSAITTPAGTDFSAYRPRLEKYGALYPGWRVKGDQRQDVNFDYLRQLSHLNRQYNGSKFIWLDLNEALTPEMAASFIDQIGAAKASGEIIGQVIIEQPVPAHETAVLSELQKRADAIGTTDDGLRSLTIMADESLLTMDDWSALAEHGGCGAVNIKIAKAGGLLAAQNIANAVYDHDPRTEIYLGGMLATSDLSALAILALARGLKRFDYTTSGPGANTRLADQPLRFASDNNPVIMEPDRSGLGAKPDFKRLSEQLVQQMQAGDPDLAPDSTLALFLKSTKPSLARAANQQDEREIPFFEQMPQPIPLNLHSLDEMPPVASPKIKGLQTIIDAAQMASSGTYQDGDDLVIKGADRLVVDPSARAFSWQDAPIAGLIGGGRTDMSARLKVASACLPKHEEFYLCVAFTPGDDQPARLLGQGKAPGLRLAVNMAPSGKSGKLQARPGRIGVVIDGASGGLGANGQSAAAPCRPGRPQVLEIIGAKGHLAAEVRVDGFLIDRLTLPETLPDGPLHLFAPAGTSSPGRVAMHAAALMHRIPKEHERRDIMIWASRRAGRVPGARPLIDIDAPILLAIDVATGRTLIERDADLPVPPASLVKLMTAALVMEEIEAGKSARAGSVTLDTRVQVIERDLWPGTSARFEPGDDVSVRDLLYGLALASGNDAGRALARIFGEQMLRRQGLPCPDIRDAHLCFVKELNLLGRRIGLSQEALFTSPIGGAETRLSAYDIARITMHAFLSAPELETIFGASQHIVAVRGARPRNHEILHTCPLLARPQGPVAAKTGTMAVAGACLMSWWRKPGCAEENNQRIVMVTLGGKDRRARFPAHQYTFAQLSESQGNRVWLSALGSVLSSH